MTKQCTQCKEIKAISEYYKKYSGRNGYAELCKICHCKSTRKRYHEKYKNNPKYKKRVREYGKQWQIEIKREEARRWLTIINNKD